MWRWTGQVSYRLLGAFRLKAGQLNLQPLDFILERQNSNIIHIIIHLGVKLSKVTDDLFTPFFPESVSPDLAWPSLPSPYCGTQL